jgi:hypothetical protein
MSLSDSNVNNSHPPPTGGISSINGSDGTRGEGGDVVNNNLLAQGGGPTPPPPYPALDRCTTVFDTIPRVQGELCSYSSLMGEGRGARGEGRGARGEGLTCWLPGHIVRLKFRYCTASLAALVCGTSGALNLTNASP